MALAGEARTIAAALTVTAASFLGSGIVSAEPQEAVQPAPQLDTAPGPAYATVDGKVTKIEGEVYTVESGDAAYLDSGIKPTEVKIYVGSQTQKMRGEKRVGDKIRAEVTRGGFANSTQ